MLSFRTMLVAGLTAIVMTSAAYAGAVKTYQVTGPVLAVTDDAIVVQKGKDKWEIARDATTKVTGDVKVGAKVTVEYRMTATAIDIKGASTTPPQATKPKRSK